MSLQNLKEYARRCATEPELRVAARSLGVSDIDGHIRHADRLGLDWTAEDMVAFRKEVIDAGDEFADLSEEELEQVAGGAVSVTAAAIMAVAGAAAAAGVASTAAGAATAAGGGGW